MATDCSADNAVTTIVAAIEVATDTNPPELQAIFESPICRFEREEPDEYKHKTPSKSRRSSSISISQVPTYMTRGQILPATGLSSSFTPPSPPSSSSIFTGLCRTIKIPKSIKARAFGYYGEGPRMAHEILSSPIAGSYAKVEKSELVDSDPEDDVDEDGGILIHTPNKKSNQLKEVIIPILSPVRAVRADEDSEKFPYYDEMLAQLLSERLTTTDNMPVRAPEPEGTLSYDHPLQRRRRRFDLTRESNVTSAVAADLEKNEMNT